MKLDLRKIIDVPGSRADFECNLDLSDLVSGQITEVVTPCHVHGSVSNAAGVLKLTAIADTVLKCTCARCLSEFLYPISRTVSVTLTEDNTGETENYSLLDDTADVDEILLSELLLSMDAVILCKPECKGLCPDCGHNQNEGPCSCKPETDPRMAVLRQLLDND